MASIGDRSMPATTGGRLEGYRPSARMEIRFDGIFVSGRVVAVDGWTVEGADAAEEAGDDAAPSLADGGGADEADGQTGESRRKRMESSRSSQRSSVEKLSICDFNY